jgi:putative transposase
MARLPRLTVAGLAHLIVQPGRSTASIFHDDDDRRVYLSALQSSARINSVAIHAYVLMDDQICLLATPSQVDGLSKLMQRVARQYVPAFNRRHGTQGSLSAGRFQATVVEAPRYLVAAICWIEQMPVSAGRVAQATDWPWSSAHHHTGRSANALVTEHPAYWHLGNTPFEREVKHQQTLQQMLTNDQQAEFVTAVRGGWPLGGVEFVALIAQNTDRLLRPGSRGRPRKAPFQAN